MTTAGKRIISADDHLQEPADLWQRRMPAKLRDQAPRLVDMEDGGQGFQIADQPPRPLGILVMAGQPPDQFKDGGLTWGDVPKATYDPTSRLEAMDADGIYATVLYPNICLDPMMDQVRLEPEVATSIYRVYNDHISEFCSHDTNRLLGAALLPLDDVQVAVGELERVAKLAGIRAALLPIIPPSGREYNDPYFEPLWDAANEIGLPLSIHAGRPRALPNRHEVMKMPGGAAVYMHIGPFSIPETFAYIIWTGVFDRYPNLKIVCVEGGIGWLAFYKQRAQQVFDRHRNWIGHGLKTGPDEWFGRNIFATFEEDAAGLQSLDLIGHGTVMWASDYPHSETTWPRSRQAIEESFQGLAEDRTRQIVHDTAAALYGIR